ncbi:MAG: RNA polymerase subunit sigma-70 [Deltaproteobacteria bacterium]|jgi:RNA polymerase sigma-70 factor (ECF subfamily)|nr:RNA polymerase subunit sigma-70 [Deltaproteobacteria bacterium]
MSPLSGSAMARHAVEAAWTSYGRLLAILASRTSDIAAAEDALSEAFATALKTWPERGVPDNPAAWLLTAARRNVLHRLRHQEVQRGAVDALLLRVDERSDPEGWSTLDERLALLFVCAHPAIDEGIRTPLMLQTVLGLDAQRIGSAFLVAPATMGQRLVRAKAKIKADGLRFEVPDASELAVRLEDVLRSVYVAYGAGWDDLDDGRGLSEEALFLGRTLLTLLPEEPEVKGLLALMLFCEARRGARLDAQGRFVPLAEQDPGRWSSPLIIEAEVLLSEAARALRFGRFQCEAAIQSVHAQRGITGVTQHHALRTLYDLLLIHVPSMGVAVARAAALLEAGDLQGGQHALDALTAEDAHRYQPYWVTRARLYELRGAPSEQRAALRRALGLTEDPAVRSFLTDKLLALGPEA